MSKLANWEWHQREAVDLLRKVARYGVPDMNKSAMSDFRRWLNRDERICRASDARARRGKLRRIK